MSLLRAATKATLPPSPAGLRASANLYFGLSAAACAACALLHAAVLPRLAAVRRRRAAALAASLHSYERLPGGEAAEQGGGAAAGAADEGLIDSVPSLRAATPAPRARHAASPGAQPADLELSADHAGLGGSPEAEPLLSPQQQQQQQQWQPGSEGGGGSGGGGSGAATPAAVLRRIWPLAAANAVVFM